MSSARIRKVSWEDMRERGVPLMLWLMIRFGLLLGRRGMRPIVYVVVAYFVVTSPIARRTSREFLRRVLGREPSALDIWRNFFAFGNCAVDRVFILAGRESELRIDVRSMPQAIESQRSKGCVLLGAHFGSLEVLRVVGDQRALPFSILLDRQIGRMLTSLFESLNPGFAASIIDASKRGPDLVLALKEAIQKDRKVGMTADRIRADDRSVTVDFFGSPAQFPISPWVLAGALRVPVFLGFGIYRGGNRYDCHFELLADRVELPRAEREAALQRYAQAYARRLEHYARLAPYNWFNFYDFWQ